MKWKMKNWGSYQVDSCSMLKKDEILLPAVSCRGRRYVPLPSVLFCHSKPLHVLLLCIHESPLWFSCFPPDWQLHLQYPSFSMCTLPPLHILTSPQWAFPSDALIFFLSKSFTPPAWPPVFWLVPSFPNHKSQQLSHCLVKLLFHSCCYSSATNQPRHSFSITRN